jgi:DsbC/DsbD-like thiol-disulfide interchange protein
MLTPGKAADEERRAAAMRYDGVMVLLLLLLSLVPAHAAQRPGDIVKWTATAPGAAVSPGGTVTVSLTATIERGWKLYALTQPEGGQQPMVISLAKGAPVTLAAKQIAGPPPKEFYEETLRVRIRYHDDSATFTVPVTVPRTATAGKLSVPLEIRFQACTNDICLVPFTQKLNTEITVAR